MLAIAADFFPLAPAAVAIVQREKQAAGCFVDLQVKAGRGGCQAETSEGERLGHLTKKLDLQAAMGSYMEGSRLLC